MPTSVLLAVLAGAGLLALAPALVRRYDADERRLAAEQEESRARVLERRSKPDPASSERPESPLDAETPQPEEPAVMSPPDDPDASVRLTPAVVDPAVHNKEVSVPSARLRAWWRKRHRRVLYVLLLLNLVELAGVVLVGPGFWIGFGVSVILLVVFVRFLRMRAVRDAAADRRRVVVAEQRQVYVPSKSEEDTEPAAIEADPVESPTGLVPGFDEEEPAGTEPAPSRRRTGGIRGRSYESPANL